MILDVRTTIEKYNMLKCGDVVLVAISGGADSVCLLHVLNKLSNYYKLKIFAAHINHLLRGEESDKDEQFVSKICNELGVTIYIHRQNALEFADIEKIGLEEAGRIIRYKFLNKIKNEIGANIITTAHNKNDQAETMIMRFLRGSGLAGLSGIKPVREDGIIRPLIETKREHILEYLKENDLQYRMDESNNDLYYLRNKVRHQLLPQLTEYNPNLLDTLSNVSFLMRSDEDFILAVSNKFAMELGVFQKNELKINISKLIDLHKAIASRVLRQLIGKSFNAYKDIEFSHIDDILNFCRTKSSGKELDISNNLRCMVSYDSLIIYNKCNDKKNAFCYFLGIDESIQITETGDIYSLNISDDISILQTENTIVFDYNVDIKGIILRSRKKGDKYTPVGVGGTQKIKDIFIDNKIPKRSRDTLVIMEANGEIIWVEGYRINDKYKININTQKVMVVSVKKGCEN